MTRTVFPLGPNWSYGFRGVVMNTYTAWPVLRDDTRNDDAPEHVGYVVDVGQDQRDPLRIPRFRAMSITHEWIGPVETSGMSAALNHLINFLGGGMWK